MDLVWNLMKKVTAPVHCILLHLKHFVIEGNGMEITIMSLRKTPHIKLREIIGVNANSYETVKQVLLNLLKQAEVPQKRK